MNSPNIKHIPLNPVGAMEMGLCPCDACYIGWVSYSTAGINSCHKSCSYWERYQDKDEMDLIQLLGRVGDRW